jgi:hypothetical protein
MYCKYSNLTILKCLITRKYQGNVDYETKVKKTESNIPKLHTNKVHNLFLIMPI